MKFHGIACRQAPDSSGETVLAEVADLRQLPGSILSMGFGRPVGRTLSARLIDGRTPADVAADAAGVPAIMVEVEITDPDTLRYLEAHPMYFGIGGRVVERDGQNLTKVVLTDVCVTTDPVDKRLRVRKA